VFDLFFSFFQVLQVSLLFVLFDFFKLQLTVQVSCLFYFLLHSRFFKGKAKSGFFGWFYCFFQVVFFKKNLGVFCWVVFSYNNPAIRPDYFLASLQRYRSRPTVVSTKRLYPEYTK